MKMHNTEIRFVIGPENRPFAGECMQYSAGKFYRLGQ